jgi:hypothetical protein
VLLLLLYSEISTRISRKPFGIGHMYIYKFLLKMTNTVTDQNIDLSFRDILYMYMRFSTPLFVPRQPYIVRRMVGRLANQSPNDHLQDNTGILYIAYGNSVSATVPLHPTCSPIRWEIAHVNIQYFVISYPPRKNQARATSIPAK